MNQKRLNDSIVTRLTLIGLALLLAGALAFYWVLANFLRDDLQQVVTAQQEALAAYVANDIDTKIVERQTMIGHLTAHLSVALVQQPDLLRAWLAVRHETQPLFSQGLFVVGLDGVVLSDYPRREGLVGMHLLDRDYVQAGLAGQASVGRPIISRVEPIPVLPVAAPIKDAQGQVRAVLVGVSALEAPGFLNVLQTTRIGKSGGFLLISPRDQLIVAATNAKLNFKPVPAPGVNPLHDRAMAGFRGSGITVEATGIEAIVAIASVPSVDWFVVATLPTEEAFATVGRLRQYMIRNGIFLSGVLLVVFLGTMRYLLRPLKTCAEQADRMTCGELPLEPLPVQRNDEVGRLTGAFNGLLAKLVATQTELANMAHYDYLTKLPNRVLLADRMKQALARASRNQTRLAMLFIDLDGFKPINDTLGHDAGDRALVEVARRLNRVVRESDTVARVGGDEFVVVLSDLDAQPHNALQAACAVADKCLEAIAAPLLLNGQKCALGFSIGIATGDGQSSFDSLVRAADGAMYQAKQQGRGRYVVANAAENPVL